MCLVAFAGFKLRGSDSVPSRKSVKQQLRGGKREIAFIVLTKIRRGRLPVFSAFNRRNIDRRPETTLSDSNALLRGSEVEVGAS